MPYEEAVRYEDVHDEEDYVAAWKASHPRETEWLKVMTSVYDGNIFLRLFDGSHNMVVVIYLFKKKGINFCFILNKID